MKNRRLLILLSLILFATLGARAQSKRTFIGVAGGYHLIPSHSYAVTLFLESAIQTRHHWEYAVEGYKNLSTGQENYTLGLHYKPSLLKSKNTVLRFRVGASAGTNGKQFIASPQAGFELSQAFAGGGEIFLQQRNYYVFGDAYRWRTGLTIGFRVSL